MAHYLARRFDEAQQAFSKVLERQADDGPAQAFVSLCEGHLAHPPPAEWNGAFVQTEK
jgi:hypothetical protein